MKQRLWRCVKWGSVAVAAALCTVAVRAENGHEAWLRYAPIAKADAAKYAALPTTVEVLGNAPLLDTARGELIRGLDRMLGKPVTAENEVHGRSAIVLGTLDAIRKAFPEIGARAEALSEEGYWLAARKANGQSYWVVAGGSERGVLYGVFALLSKIARNEEISSLNEVQRPYARLRWVDQWDNLDGSIERGYGGRSIFFEDGRVRADLARVREYARLLASIGVNGCAINNVNANPVLLTPEFLPEMARIADVFREWGIRMAISIDLSSPKKIGGLDTFDPLDERLLAWWRDKADEIYRRIPDFGGLVVKADSEGRPGPSAYGRTPADAANAIARALKPHGGIVFYRAFVYDHHLNWEDPKADRARAAYDIFHPLDGKFDDNVVIQIKHGPIDFQVREPVSPLFGGLQHTSMAMELQITQEYMGQQRHLCYLAPMWKEALDFDLGLGDAATPTKTVVSGRTFGRPTGGLVGVANVGNAENWLGHPLALANLYAFGRLAWNPELDTTSVAEEWTRQTFGNDAAVAKTITEMQAESWRVYEDYTGPLGLQTLTDILRSHYGPGVEASERNGWGQWHRADQQGVGMDRSLATGTGFAGQYAPRVAAMYESVEQTSEELLLFFHHVPYTRKLKSGKTLIQTIYDLHYEGAEKASEYAEKWRTLKGHFDDERYEDVLRRLEYQAGHAIVWRDAVCRWFLRESGIADERGRVGNYPERVEAESMRLDGYTVVDVDPWENASGGKAIECARASGCTGTFSFAREAGTYELDVEYFDQNNGESKFSVSVNGKTVDEWIANDKFPSSKIGGDTSVRRRIKGLALQPGDEIRISGTPDGGEHAVVDYLEVHRKAN